MDNNGAVQKKIVCIGDSITYGYGVTGDQSWIGILKNKYGMDWINVGINGDTTSGMLIRFGPHVLRFSPDYVFIMGGANDLVQEVSAEFILENIKKMVIKSRDAGITPILGLQPHPSGKDLPMEWKMLADYGSIADNTHRYRHLLIQYCHREGIPYIDFDQEMKNRLKGRYRHYFSIDGVHPDANGHRIMAQIAEDFFRKEGLLIHIS